MWPNNSIEVFAQGTIHVEKQVGQRCVIWNPSGDFSECDPGAALTLGLELTGLHELTKLHADIHPFAVANSGSPQSDISRPS